uniref:Uncharacterized protein n=1 Tax=Guillardia theta TaxID=55529 RepID=A0A6U6AII9_GUITH|mmetsp:Transcript_32772/g.103690  ORF Transcript_32772/g.103690 Transcript_32772/m.103690 type:complete len:398 (+) Transcript_32772:66-1259(+)
MKSFSNRIVKTVSFDRRAFQKNVQTLSCALSTYKPTAEEHRYAESLQRSSMDRMRRELNQEQLTTAIPKEHLDEDKFSGVDVVGPIAAASVWQRLAKSRKSQVAVSKEDTNSDQSGFRIVVEQDGSIRAIPKERVKREPTPEEKEIRFMKSIAGIGDMSDSEFKRKYHWLLPGTVSGRKHEDSSSIWTRNTFNDTPYIWWPGSWIRYSKILLEISRNRFKFFRYGEIQGQKVFAAAAQSARLESRSETVDPETNSEIIRMMEEREKYMMKIRELNNQLRILGVQEGSDEFAEDRKAEGTALAWKAFLIATLIVLTSSSAALWVFCKRTGIRSFREFREFAKDYIQSDEIRKSTSEYSALANEWTPKVRDSTLSELATQVSRSLHVMPLPNRNERLDS